VNDRGEASVGHSPPCAVDLFCGAGGLAHGLQKAGLAVLAGIDLDSDCKFPFETNNSARFIHADVASLGEEDLIGLFPKDATRRVLVGCAPCQPFSRYARANRPLNFKRWGLLNHFLRLSLSLRPAVITMENVPEIQHDQIFVRFVEKLRNSGYQVNYSNVFCPDYGIPQNRTRLVLLASLYGSVDLQSSTHAKGQYCTVRQAISNLPPLRAGEVASTDTLHRSSRLTPINAERIRKSKPSGCWRDWPERLVAECHRAQSGKTYPGVYGRMGWDLPSPTITTQFFGYGNGRFGHPVQNRALSLREGAILQSFPNDYSFAPPGTKMSFAKLGQLIGNAVPVRLAEVIGNAILKHLETVRP
jgi:DNA (cytosine-5)-methyltransferase 1